MGANLIVFQRKINGAYQLVRSNHLARTLAANALGIAAVKPKIGAPPASEASSASE
jgi:hypothetical protein